MIFSFWDVKLSVIALFCALMERRMGVTSFFSAQILTRPRHCGRGQSVQFWCTYLFWFGRYKGFTLILQNIFFHFSHLQVHHKMGKVYMHPCCSFLLIRAFRTILEGVMLRSWNFHQILLLSRERRHWNLFKKYSLYRVLGAWDRISLKPCSRVVVLIFFFEILPSSLYC